MAVTVSQPLRWLSVFSMSIGLTSCGVSTVRSVHEHPQRHWFNTMVSLEGTVVDRVPLLNAQVYQLQDSTGAIWILTTDPSLQPGEQVTVKGKVRFESIPIAGQELGEAYIEEHQRQRVKDDEAE